MRIADKMAVSIHYTLTNDEGEVIDSSDGNEPLVYLHGYGNIISGLEAALTDKAVGDKLNVRIEPEDAYGLFYEDRIQVIPRAMFEGINELAVGMQFHADVSSGPGVVTIVDIDGDDITIDGNHPLAGVPLTFAVEIIDIRPAADEELAHGHIHGSGCHH
ncbi:FKBP-type peptidyl-prolyl cis-trans isomerase [Methylocucumis oryzae]|uniref:Peptidyl-prolyl cis-trans isomerase n=1 Tax=Methylocucumis oryzae TaxID=1632867 RepID=A0A0F3IGM7_9GAMM|nr:peptidylprolyl isomerase [Methylocucumis oryzae]KJV05916.1 peptidylprolyl isomerase [Methylocucumis oryzae]